MDDFEQEKTTKKGVIKGKLKLLIMMKKKIINKNWVNSLQLIINIFYLI